MWKSLFRNALNVSGLIAKISNIGEPSHLFLIPRTLISSSSTLGLSILLLSDLCNWMTIAGRAWRSVNSNWYFCVTSTLKYRDKLFEMKIEHNDSRALPIYRVKTEISHENAQEILLWHLFQEEMQWRSRLLIKYSVDLKYCPKSTISKNILPISRKSVNWHTDLEISQDCNIRKFDSSHFHHHHPTSQHHTDPQPEGHHPHPLPLRNPVNSEHSATVVLTSPLPSSKTSFHAPPRHYERRGNPGSTNWKTNLYM